MHTIYKRITAISLLGVSLLLGGCASAPNGVNNPADPLESFNRNVFAFNESVDKHVMRPVAEGYDKVMPEPVKNGVSNFFSNLGDVVVILNDLLQFKFAQAAQDLSRFVYNTPFGLAGLMDVATPMGLPKHHEDFGQTLGSWGVGDGPFLVLPFLGPSTLRDTSGMVGDWQYAPALQVEDDSTRYSLITLNAVDVRYKLLKASRIVDEAALDRYSFVRDAYLQYRHNQIHDGQPPEEKKAAPPPVTSEDLELEKLLELDSPAKKP